MNKITIFIAIRKLKAELLLLTKSDGNDDRIEEIKRAILHYNDKLKKDESLN
jgi:hypothetical protein